MIAVVRRVWIAVLVASLVAVAVARADETITAHTPNQFGSAVTTIDQGEKVTFRNLDIVGHDVTAKGRTSDGQPVFRTDGTVEPQSTGPVRGTEYLTSGSYPFVCTIHPGMEATLKVTSKGTPLKRPEPPSVHVKILSGDLQKVVKKRKLKLRVTATKSVVKLTAKLKSKKLGKASVTFDSDGKQAVALKLTKSGRKALAGRKSAKVKVTAVARDAAGQTAKASATRKLS